MNQNQKMQDLVLLTVQFTLKSVKRKVIHPRSKHCITETADISLISDNKSGKFVYRPLVCLSKLQSRTE